MNLLIKKKNQNIVIFSSVSSLHAVSGSFGIDIISGKEIFP